MIEHWWYPESAKSVCEKPDDTEVDNTFETEEEDEDCDWVCLNCSRESCPILPF